MPITNPVEMAMTSEQAAVDAIAAVPAYQEAFGRAFPKEAAPITYDNVAAAIAAFEDTLVTPSRFDRFLAGNHGALSTTEREGLKLFMGKGCASCHQGVAVGGGMYAKFGVTAPYANQKDPGRFKVTGKMIGGDFSKAKIAPENRTVENSYPLLDGIVTYE